MSNPHQPTVLPRVGVVGAGQLARMMGEAASSVGVEVTVLATSEVESAVATTTAFLVGEPDNEGALRALAAVTDVITFDHELVNLELLDTLENEGVVFLPKSTSLRFAVDKAYQRHAFREANIPVPRFLVVRSSKDDRLTGFLDELGSPPVLKTARGGYDGRGVVFPSSRRDTLRTIDTMSGETEVVVEERLTLQSEVAQVVVRALDGSLVFYPVVDTVQRDGMCVEVRFPSQLDASLLERAHDLSQRVVDVVQGVGVLAIEYFVTERGLLVNEVALRPHNTGHWSIEGTATSQFAQHLLAVSNQPLGDVTATAPQVVMVNVVGSDEPGSLDAARDVANVHVHDYGKSWRPGRKLGHVTALGDDATDVHVRAWTSARAYGTGTQEA